MISDIFLNNGTLSIPLMLWMIYIAVVIGTVIYFTVNYQLGKIVTKLIEKGASSPDSALTVEEAEINYGFFTKMCLKSPANYKQLLVAITTDGKFYSNASYTDDAPKFKQLNAITRKNKSRVKDSFSSAPLIDTEAPLDTKSQQIDTKTNNAPPEKVKFNTYTAKYYIPSEIHDKVKGMFKTPKTNIFVVIGTLLALAVVIYFAGFLAETFFDSFI